MIPSDQPMAFAKVKMDEKNPERANVLLKITELYTFRVRISKWEKEMTDPNWVFNTVLQATDRIILILYTLEEEKQVGPEVGWVSSRPLTHQDRYFLGTNSSRLARSLSHRINRTTRRATPSPAIWFEHPRKLPPGDETITYHGFSIIHFLHDRGMPTKAAKLARQRRSAMLSSNRIIVSYLLPLSSVMNSAYDTLTKPSSNKLHSSVPPWWHFASWTQQSHVIPHLACLNNDIVAASWRTFLCKFAKA